MDHNLFVQGDLIYEANYTSGLRVFDATNPIAPVEIGFFDTYPESDAVGSGGAWAPYPFLPSGIVIVSDYTRGLFVLRLDDGSCPADTDGDGTVGILDFLGLLAAWGSADPIYDIEPPGGDGIVGITDFLSLLAAWGPCP